jgi:hypothetical protein
MQKGFLLAKKSPVLEEVKYGRAAFQESGQEMPMLWDDAMRDRLQDSMQSLLIAIRGISMADLGRYSLQARQYCEAWQDSPAGYKLETIVDNDTATSNAWLREEMLDIAERCSVPTTPGTVKSGGSGGHGGPPPSISVTSTNRVQAALSTVFLSRAATQLDHIGFSRTLAAQLSAYVYDGHSMLESRTTLSDCLAETPYFEKLVVMRTQVDKLVHERVKLEREEKFNEKHRRTRKKLIATAVNYRRKGCMTFFFMQWKGNVQSLMRQREALVAKLLKMREKSARQIFDAWKTWAIETKLLEMDRNQVETNIMIANLEDELRHARVVEEEVRASVDKLRKDELKLQKQLAETNAAIEAQRVPETMKLLEVAGGAAKQLGHAITQIVQPLIAQIEGSPSYEKLAQVYWSARNEELAADEDAKRMEAEAEDRRRVQVMAAKRQKREIKIRAAALKKLEKRRLTAEKDARSKAEDEYRAAFEDEEATGFSRDDMAAAGDKAAKSAGYELEKEYQAWLKEREEKEKARRAEAEAQQAEEAKKNEAAFYRAQAERDAKGSGLSEEDILASENGFQELPCEEVVLRWMKYHLRRTCRKGYQYRRKGENYNEDLRDGVTYLVLLKTVLGEDYRAVERAIYKGDETKSLDEEIDPQVRLEALMTMAEKLPHPATSFNTSGHILGNDSFLNGAFLTRMLMTNHGFQPDAVEGSDIAMARDKYSQVMDQWGKVCTLISQLGKWDDWKKIRTEYDDDKQLATLLETLPACASQLQSLLLMLYPMAMAAERGRKLWVGLRKRLLHEFQWPLFAIKVLQEEEAPNGVDIDVNEGHAPIKLVNHKFDRTFLKYTQLSPSRVKAIIESTKLRDETKERHWNKIEEVAQKAKEAKRKVEPGEDDLTTEELAEIAASMEPTTDAEVAEEQTKWCKLLRLNFSDISKVFKFYAAGDEGAADGLSSAEWWNICNDIKILKGNKRVKLEKPELQEVFDETETPEDIEAARILQAKKDAAEESAENVLSEDEDASMDQLDAEEGSESGDGDDDEDEDDEEEIVEFDLDDGERELGPAAFVEALLRLGMRKFSGTDPEKFVGYEERLRRLINDFLLPNAGKSNTETFRGELSLDEVQLVYKKFKSHLMAIFMYYGREHEPVPGQPKPEPSMDGPGFLKMLKESKVSTRSGDLRDDFRETAARKVFNDTQVEEEGTNSIDTGGGTDEMIYMEYIEVGSGNFPLRKCALPRLLTHFCWIFFLFTDSGVGCDSAVQVP